MNLTKVLFVGAHPDDVEMNAGGTIAKLVDAGVEVHVAVLTSTDERARESLEACMALGVKNVVFLRGHDTTLADCTGHMVQVLDSLIDMHKFDTVFTHFHADTHQDHVAAYQIAVAAARKVKNFLMFKPTYPSGRPDIPFHPTFISMLRYDHLERKTRALDCFKSQRTKYGDDKWAEAMQSVAAGDAWTYGGTHGWAEVFQASRLMLD